MKAVSIKRITILIMAIVLAAMAFASVQSVWAAGTAAATKSTTKTAEKPKTVTINIVIMAEADADVDLTVEKKKEKKDKKVTAITRTVSLKKGLNYFTYNKGKKGNYTVTMVAFGDTLKQSITAVQGAYTVFFKVAPPVDGDKGKMTPVIYRDLTIEEPTTQPKK